MKKNIYFYLSILIPVLACITGGILWEFLDWYKMQENILQQTQQQFATSLRIHEQEKQWQFKKDTHKDLMNRLNLIKKTSKLSVEKITYLIEKMAKYNELTQVHTHCQPPTKMIGPLSQQTCSLSARALTDQSIFRFLTHLIAYVPNILILKTGEIQRTSALTPEMLLDLSNHKPLSLFTVSVSFDWLSLNNA